MKLVHDLGNFWLPKHNLTCIFLFAKWFNSDFSVLPSDLRLTSLNTNISVSCLSYNRMASIISKRWKYIPRSNIFVEFEDFWVSRKMNWAIHLVVWWRVIKIRGLRIWCIRDPWVSSFYEWHQIRMVSWLQTYHDMIIWFW